MGTESSDADEVDVGENTPVFGKSLRRPASEGRLREQPQSKRHLALQLKEMEKRLAKAEAENASFKKGTYSTKRRFKQAADIRRVGKECTQKGVLVVLLMMHVL